MRVHFLQAHLVAPDGWWIGTKALCWFFPSIDSLSSTWVLFLLKLMKGQKNKSILETCGRKTARTCAAHQRRRRNYRKSAGKAAAPWCFWQICLRRAWGAALLVFCYKGSEQVTFGLFCCFKGQEEENCPIWHADPWRFSMLPLRILIFSHVTCTWSYFPLLPESQKPEDKLIMCTPAMLKQYITDKKIFIADGWSIFKTGKVQ